MLGAGKRNRLPREYQEVEYLANFFIDTNAGQYINVGTTTSANRKVIWDLQRYQSSRQLMIQGNGGSTTGVLYSFRADNALGYFSFVFPNYTVRTSIPIDTERHLITIDNTNKTYSIDNEIGSYSLTLSGGTYMERLFAYAQLSSINHNYDFLGAIYSAKYYDSDVLVRDFVPCYRKIDNKPGMYDLCGSICPLSNSPFYINAGNGEFLVGPDVN